MDYNYNYRIGLIIERNGFIDTVNAQDMVDLSMIPSKRTFEPIILTENIFKAYGFIKSQERHEGYYYYIKDGITVEMRPFTNKYYCSNLRVSRNFSYLHELQELLDLINPNLVKQETNFTDFVIRYGSRYLSVYDK
jgi:hypothetical protein